MAGRLESLEIGRVWVIPDYNLRVGISPSGGQHLLLLDFRLRLGLGLGTVADSLITAGFVRHSTFRKPGDSYGSGLCKWYLS